MSRATKDWRKRPKTKGKQGRVMKEATDVLKIVGMVLLALFVLVRRERIGPR